MSFEEKRNPAGPSGPKKPHKIALEDRKALSVSGVEEVERFDEREILLRTTMGALLIEGAELSVSRLSVESGDVSVQGRIDALSWQDAEHADRSVWSRLFH